jgi:hypothetical protein
MVPASVAASRDARSPPRRACPGESVRIVKKTLKGDLLGKTGFKKVGRQPETKEPEAPNVKPRGQARLDTVVPDPDDLVIVSDPLHPRRGPATLAGSSPKRAMTPEESKAMAEAEMDVAAMEAGVTESSGGRRGNVTQIGKDGHERRSDADVVAQAQAAARARAEAELAAKQKPAQKAAEKTQARSTQKPQEATAQSAPVATPSAPQHATQKSPSENGSPTKTTQPEPPLAEPGRRLEQEAAGRARKLGTHLEGDAVSLARNVIAEALYRQFGAPGTKMQQPRGGSYEVQARFGSGIVRTQHELLLPLPAGHVAPHMADLVIELDPRGLLVLDILPSHVTLRDLKAHAYDALQLRRIDRCFSVLVYVRCPGAGMSQGQAEAIAHGYDYHFGIDEEHVHSEAKFQVLRNRVTQWLEAASAANHGSR